MGKKRNQKPRAVSRARSKSLQALYRKAREEFTAADLQKFTVIEKGIPLKKVVADMIRIQERLEKRKA